MQRVGSAYMGTFSVESQHSVIKEVFCAGKQNQETQPRDDVSGGGLVKMQIYYIGRIEPINTLKTLCIKIPWSRRTRLFRWSGVIRWRIFWKQKKTSAISRVSEKCLVRT